MHMRARSSFSRRHRLEGALASLGAVLAAIGLATGASPAGAQSGQQSAFLKLAEQGAAQAQSRWGDGTQGLWNGHRNVPVKWYDERLGRRSRYPLTTIWGALPLFESLSAIAIAEPTSAHRVALARFAEGSHPPARGPSAARRGKLTLLGGAEAYWDPAMGGYAPYPGDRGRVNVWFDDNAWWGLGFMDTFRALGNARYLADAQNAFHFIASRGWTPAGGLWWNTAHTPNGQVSGEPLAAGALLGAQLAQSYLAAAQSATGAAQRSDRATAAYDLQNVEKFLSWGDAHFADDNGLYWRTGQDPTPTPYIAGPATEAKEVLCKLLAQPNPYCAQARQLANAAFARFAYRLNMGPQFDTNYLHWMLVYGQQTGDQRWSAMALHMATMAQTGARDPGTGLYLRAWDGTDMSGHQAAPGMLRTDAATVELFGWLAALGP
jgi:hypothetical protein